jgi:hypothetical protein
MKQVVRWAGEQARFHLSFSTIFFLTGQKKANN